MIGWKRASSPLRLSRCNNLSLGHLCARDVTAFARVAYCLGSSLRDGK